MISNYFSALLYRHSVVKSRNQSCLPKKYTKYKIFNKIFVHGKHEILMQNFLTVFILVLIVGGTEKIFEPRFPYFLSLYILWTPFHSSAIVSPTQVVLASPQSSIHTRTEEFIHCLDRQEYEFCTVLIKEAHLFLFFYFLLSLPFP